MKNKVPFGLLILAIAIGGFFVTKLENDTFKIIYSVLGILVIVLSYFLFSKKKV
ncbi:uncharacterized membrane protein YcaP (DUF421 family) [Paenibacillus sp. W4I10]|uniref:hypothetical protein n=1 Tax=Paenibacillus sp. W4I10 TaxID=3042298 RepID=UPI00278310AD|nr:hypothetical protein [Paenibacillus sp. W4I10]MDQ0719786.1 uncharacterized membrane protein YcaP (DUF421 family) [Paenibacillus sp. W4I10]